MLAEDLGDDVVLVGQLGFERLDLAVAGTILGLAVLGEGLVEVAQGLLLPVVELVGMDLQFLADLRDAHAVLEMADDSIGFLLRAEGSAGTFAHGVPPVGLTGSTGPIKPDQQKSRFQ